ncbi:unnamed protein product [Acanthoscelides obtectus]|uniref:Uncharacterized protein n=1 Tax=Acanthoscelides obtectus TaxID=200917 RepID=A0A9P0PE15_ACAOB|nr:unnamed protein product [Acanthoscelides obtectus]CAK1655143.1 hypothetical protein AOBTE_LOCUS19047 [Acanthoscelides obtectus]
MYGYSTAPRSSFEIRRQEYDFGHRSGLEPIPNRPQATVHSVNAESTSANSQATNEEEFDFSSAFQEHI